MGGCKSLGLDFSVFSHRFIVIVIKNLINPEGHQNPINGSKVTAILMMGWIWPIGGVASGRVCAAGLLFKST